MGRTNACRAQQKRERNLKAGGKTANSQLKKNQECQTIQCKVCFQTFMSVTNERSLREHSENKHPKKSFQECYPDYTA